MIRIATIGTSGITACMLDALSHVEGATFAGTFSRDRQRAAAFTSEHGGTTPFTSLDELAASDEVDAVYIASPNALHHDQALACIAGGKHVIVEKPFCANRREADEVFEAARHAGLVALEAMRPLHDPAFHAIKELPPQIGAIRVDLRPDAARQTDSVGYSTAQTIGWDIDLPAFENTMQHELSDFVDAVEHVRAGGDCTEAPCGPFGTVARFRDITLASLDITDEARRQMGVSFPADRTAPTASER